MANRHSENDVRTFLRGHGLPDTVIQDVISGIDFSHPVYPQNIDLGNTVYQYVRTPSARDPFGETGSWYCLRGTLMDRLAVHHPDGPRQMLKYDVVGDFVALESTALQFRLEDVQDPQRREQLARLGIGGSGGGTQIFVPRSLAHNLSYAGHADAADVGLSR